MRSALEHAAEEGAASTFAIGRRTKDNLHPAGRDLAHGTNGLRKRFGAAGRVQENGKWLTAFQPLHAVRNMLDQFQPANYGAEFETQRQGSGRCRQAVRNVRITDEACAHGGRFTAGRQEERLLGDRALYEARRNIRFCM